MGDPNGSPGFLPWGGSNKGTGSERCLCLRECMQWRSRCVTFWWRVRRARDLLLQGRLRTHPHVDHRLCSSFQNYKHCPQHWSTLLDITQTLSSTGTAIRRSLCEAKAKTLLHSTSKSSNHSSIHLFLAVQLCRELSARGSSRKDTGIRTCTHIGIFVRACIDIWPISIFTYIPTQNPQFISCLKS